MKQLRNGTGKRLPKGMKAPKKLLEIYKKAMQIRGLGTFKKLKRTSS